MASDEHFRAALDNLAARLNRDVARHLDSAAEELTAKAETLTAAADLAHADALAQSEREARAEAERTTAERLTAAFGAERAALAAQVSRDTWAEAERATTERLTAAFEADRADLTAQAAREARAEAERTTTERLTSAFEADRLALVERASREAWVEAERVTSDRLQASFEATHAQALQDVRAEADRTTSALLTAAVSEAETRTHVNFEKVQIDAGDRLVQAVRAIDSAQSLSDTLNALVTAATAETRRVALFLTQPAQFRSLQHVGFDPVLATSDQFEIPVAEARMLADAVSTRSPIVAGEGENAEAPAFAQLPRGRGAIAAPLVINDEVAAVLYADHGADGAVTRQSWPATIEVLARHASRALEALTAQRLARTLADRPGASRLRSVPRPPGVAAPS